MLTQDCYYRWIVTSQHINSKCACLQGLTSRLDAPNAFSHGYAYASPAKPRPAGRPALQPVSTNSPGHVPNSLPLSSGPFPGITKNMYSHLGITQVPPYSQQAHTGSAAPGSAIPAQHALSLMHASNAHAGSYSLPLSQGSMQPQMTAFHHQTDINSMIGVQGQSYQSSHRALDRGFGASSPWSVATEGEKSMCGFAPQHVTATQPQSAQGTATVVNSGKSDNTYVSFDEWRAQVHAKLSLAPSNNTASADGVGLPYSDHWQPLGWLPTGKAPDFQYGK